MYWINHNNSYLPGKQIAFECDGPDDIQDLPTSTKEGKQMGDDTISCKKVNTGSSCLCIETSDYYKLNSNDEWKPI